MVDVVERLKQMFQGAENLSQRDQMVKAQLEKQLELELGLRGGDHLPAGGTAAKKCSILRTFRQNPDPVMSQARPGPGSTSLQGSRHELFQLAGH